MTCLVDSPFDPNADTKLTAIEFWYSVENKANHTNSFAHAIESEIYQVSFSLTPKKPTLIFVAHHALLCLIDCDSIHIIVSPIQWREESCRRER